MSNVALMSNVYAPTLKEIPAEAELASHKLLLRAGMIRKSAAGIYSFLPLGYRVIKKIENIVREEMDAIGSQELLLPFVQPAELWTESGRWDVYGPELARLKDRHGREFCLGPTHEEIITSIVRADVRSYRELPLSLYQINLKFRDEIRPRFGLLRGREFIMKDAYSFHTSYDSLQEHYDEQARAYGRICERLGLDYRPVEADSGQIGGKVTTEFMALADAGEANLVYCSCGWAANTEVGEALIARTPISETEKPLEKIHTPNMKTIAQLSEFLSIPEPQTVKTMVGKDAEGTLIYFMIPGDRELNEIKAAYAVPNLILLSEEDFASLGIPKGSLGPVNATPGAKIVADRSLMTDFAWIVGANEDDYHFINASHTRDFTVDLWADLITAQAKDTCPECGGVLESARGIEVSQVFQLGTRYSEAMGATFKDESGEEKPFIMGCYGVGVSRSMAAVVEQYNDDSGIKWPVSIAPYEVAVIPLATDGEAMDIATEIAEALAHSGIEVVLDDRNERPGFKFADAELIGWPMQIVVGKRGVEAGVVEVKTRATSEKIEVPIASAAQSVIDAILAQRALYAH